MTLFCFDLDGTLTETEILPELARACYIEEEMKLLTKATIEGIIPFEASFRLRCQLLKDLSISEAQQIVLSINLNKDIEQFIFDHRDSSVVITGNLDCWVQPLISRLGCRFVTSIASVEGDRLVSVVQVVNKGQAISELRSAESRIVAIGDGMGDVSMLSTSDVGVAYGGVHSPVRSVIEVASHVIFDGESLCRFLLRQ